MKKYGKKYGAHQSGYVNNGDASQRRSGFVNNGMGVGDPSPYVSKGAGRVKVGGKSFSASGPGGSISGSNKVKG